MEHPVSLTAPINGTESSPSHLATTQKTQLAVTGLTSEKPRQNFHSMQLALGGQTWQIEVNDLDTSKVTPSDLAELQQTCTCWSSGKLNIRLTTDKVIGQLGRALGRTGLFNRVLRERSKSADVSLKSIIQEAAISPEDLKILNATLGDRSASFSVIVWNPQSGDPALQCILESGSGNYPDRHSTFRYE